MAYSVKWDGGRLTVHIEPNATIRVNPWRA